VPIVIALAGLFGTASAVMPMVASAAPTWISPAATLNASPFGSQPQSPLVATNGRGDTVVAWQSNQGQPLFESERPASGSFTAASQPVFTQGGNDLNLTNYQVGSLSLDNAGTIHVIFLSGNSNATFQINEATKPIGGATWTVTVVQVPGIAGNGFANANPPVAGAVAPSGAAVAVWLNENTGNFPTSQFRASTRPAGSSIWSTPVNIASAIGGGSLARVAVDNNGDAAAVYAFSGNANLYGATKPAGGSWTTSSQITTAPASGAYQSPFSVALDSSGQATAAWSMTNNSNNLTVQFSTKALAAASWPQAPAPGGVNDLSTTASTTGLPSLSIGPDGATVIAYTQGSSVFARTRPGAGGAFASSTLPNTLTSTSGAAAVIGGDGSTTVLWSGLSGSTPTIAGAYRPASGSTFAATPNAPGVSDANVSAAVDGFGDVSAAWGDQTSPGNYVYQASGLVTGAPTISNVSFPSTATSGTPFAYSATVTPGPWTTASASWSFGDGTTGAPSGNKAYAAAGVFNAVLTATDPFGNTATQPFSITVVPAAPGGTPGGGTPGGGTPGGGTPGGGGGGGGAKPRAPGKPHLKAKLKRKKHTAKFTFSAKGATRLQCALLKLRPKRKHKKQPKPSFVKCGSPRLYKKLSGQFEFFVRGTNSGGTGPPATFTFRI
jgi:hypothetical protein